MASTVNTATMILCQYKSHVAYTIESIRDHDDKPCFPVSAMHLKHMPILQKWLYWCSMDTFPCQPYTVIYFFFLSRIKNNTTDSSIHAILQRQNFHCYYCIWTAGFSGCLNTIPKPAAASEWMQMLLCQQLSIQEEGWQQDNPRSKLIPQEMDTICIVYGQI